MLDDDAGLPIVASFAAGEVLMFMWVVSMVVGLLAPAIIKSGPPSNHRNDQAQVTEDTVQVFIGPGARLRLSLEGDDIDHARLLDAASGTNVCFRPIQGMDVSFFHQTEVVLHNARIPISHGPPPSTEPHQ